MVIFTFTLFFTGEMTRSHGSKASLAALYYTSNSSKPINFVSDIVLLSQDRSPTLISSVSLAYDYRLKNIVNVNVVDLAYKENWELQKVTATDQL